METEFESIQLTLGGLLFIIGLAVSVAGAVWTVAKIRNADKESIEKGYTNALNRIDNKHSESVDVLHARVNRLIEKDSEVQHELGYLKGRLDK